MVTPPSLKNSPTPEQREAKDLNQGVKASQWIPFTNVVINTRHSKNEESSEDMPSISEGPMQHGRFKHIVMI